MIWWALLILWLLAEIDLRAFRHRAHVSRIPRWLDVQAVTIGRHILVAGELLETDAAGRLLAHERAHVEQYRRFTMVGFPIVFFVLSLRYGYKRNPLEVEARSLAELIHPEG